MENDQLITETDASFLVSTRAFTDPEVFEREMRQIFESTWVYVAHESQLKEVGDYITTVIGRQPVIVSRAEDGEVHVMLNRCRHRGSVVARAERGHSNHFRCPYHNWIYSNDGALLGCAQMSGYQDFDRASHGLLPAAAVGVYRGLVFASLQPPTESLETRLEDVRPYIDLWVDRSPTQSIETTQHAHKISFAGNWKFQMENGNDGYHGNYVHESFMHLVERAGEATVKSFREVRNTGSVVGLSHGDGFIDRPEGGMAGQFDYHDERYASYHAELDETVGADRRQEILGQRNLLIFPNLYLFESHIRVLHPQTPSSTVVVMQPFHLGGVDRSMNVDRLRTYERFFGSAGFGSPDDVEMFLNCQTGMAAEGVETNVLNRGMHRETHLNGRDIGGHTTDEAPQRSAYRAWQSLMQTDEQSGSDS